MKCTLKIKRIKTLNEVEGSWTIQDYIELLSRLDFQKPEEIAPQELQEMLFMAITDFEPQQAAEIVLTYTLSDALRTGQIQQLAHEMMEDKVAEEYPDIALHFPLFNVNQLLFKAYNGSFPNTKASILEVEIHFPQHPNIEMNKELALKALCNGLRESNLINRLYPDQLAGKTTFPEADHIIWDFHQSEKDTYSIITSDYWINQEDILGDEFEGVVNEFIDED
ncbi:MAG: hypothetical protein KDC34_13175 [Saprospiraceae bacterium]|nr:hypothetical protein [Saprospiraceae bacterium]